MQQQNKNPIITVFYSYAHEDEPFRKQLETHLSLLRRQGLISEWYDREILPGAERAKEIDAHLETATIILLLISPCDWRTAPFAHLQCLPRDSKPVTTWDNQDEAFLAIAQELRHIIEHLTEIPQETQSRLLNQTNHLCCVCHQKGKHIHHIDGDLLNADIGNLAVLCESCSSELQKGKIAAPQLRLYMATLYAEFKHYSYAHAIRDNFWDGPHGIRTLTPNAALEEFSSLAKEIVQFIHTHRDDFSPLSGDQVQHILNLYQAIAKVERTGSLFMNGISKVTGKLSDVKKAQFVKEFGESVSQFGGSLALVNLDLLDIYSPGLGKKIYGLIVSDVNLFMYIANHLGRIDPQGNSYQDIVLGLFAEHFSGDGYWELELHARSAAHSQSAIQTSLSAITECKEMLRQLIQEHWKLDRFLQ